MTIRSNLPSPPVPGTPARQPTNAELLISIDQAMAALMYIHAQLSKKEAAAAGVAPEICPIHKVAFRKYSLGLAHPPQKPGEKWCRKKD